MAQRTWPTREGWAAKAEHSVRTACYLSQRVSSNPTTWITEAELTEARALVVQIIKATRAALTRAGRADERAGLNKAGRRAGCEYADVDELGQEWSRIAGIADSVQAASDASSRLSDLVVKMLTARDAAAQADLDAAIERAVALRNTDEGWAAELERRASIEAGPLVTRH